MGGYENIKSLLMDPNSHSELSLSKKLVAGATAGALGAGIANPSDLVNSQQLDILTHQKDQSPHAGL
jgi:hypothetical protein